MLGGIKAILFLKQCSAPTPPFVISSRLLLQDEMWRGRASAGVPLREPPFNCALAAINVPAPDSGRTHAEPKTIRVPQVGEDLGAMFSAAGETVV